MTNDFILEPKNGEKITDLDYDEIVTLYKKHKVIWFRGFDVDMEEFNTLTLQFCKDFSDYRGGGSKWKSIDRQVVNNDKTLMTATGHTQNFTIPLHGEMYYMDNPPELIYFYCLTPAESGGQTIVCNGADLLKNLDEEARDFFMANKIKYVRYLPDGDWQNAFMLDNVNDLKEFCASKGMTVKQLEDNAVITEYVCNPVLFRDDIQEHVFINNLPYIYFAEMAFKEGWIKENLQSDAPHCPIVVRMEDGTEIPRKYVDSVMKSAEKLSVDIDWKKGDIAMVDNTVMLHGRKKSPGEERKILVKMGSPMFEL